MIPSPKQRCQRCGYFMIFCTCGGFVTKKKKLETVDSYGDAMNDDHMVALIDLIRRTGAEETVIRFDEPEEVGTGPTVWIAATRHGEHWSANGDVHPVRAVFKLAEQLIDGGQCRHCQRPSGITNDYAGDFLAQNPLFCYYVYDPEMQRYERSCRHTPMEKTRGQ